MQATWTSNLIELGHDVSVDVSASSDGVTLNESANRVLAADLHMQPEKAMELADALTQAAAKCLQARGAK